MYNLNLFVPIQGKGGELKSLALYLVFCLMQAAFTFFPVKKSNQKRPVQKKAIAKHRSFSSQNAFSIAKNFILLFLLYHLRR
jgi:hypothetical protein